jgi:hypothetical protein
MDQTKPETYPNPDLTLSAAMMQSKMEERLAQTPEQLAEGKANLYKMVLGDGTEENIGVGRQAGIALYAACEELEAGHLNEAIALIKMADACVLCLKSYCMSEDAACGFKTDVVMGFINHLKRRGI